MTIRLRNTVTLLSFLIAFVVSVAGCGASGTDKSTTQNTSPANAAVADAGHNLDGWWCTEHGIPEEECSMCSDDAATKCKEKGDWCQKHDRAESQCFICHPELQAKFAERYEAKFGKKPPQPNG